MKTIPLKYLSLFSGIEAASVAWKDIGWEPVGFSEIEPFPCAVLKHRFPNTPNYGDITKWKEWGLVPGTVDVVCAGSPCQAFSCAGLRKGLDDPRGNLALVTLGLVEFLKPKWFIWENVPGVLTAQQGSAFGAILTALGDIGYGWAYRVLDAVHFGVPQRRRRVWLCAYRDPVTGAGDWRPPTAVLSFSESLCGDSSAVQGKAKANARKTYDGIAEGDRGCWWDGGQVSQTLDAVLAKGQMMPEKNRFPAVLQPIVIDRAAFNQGVNAQYAPHIEETQTMDTLVAKGPHAVYNPPLLVRRITPREGERLQGFPDDWTCIPWKNRPADECPDGPRYKAIGNSWAVPCAKYIGERINLVEEIKDEISKA